MPEPKPDNATPPQQKPAATSIPDASQDVDPRSNRAKVERALSLTERIRARLAQPPPVQVDPRSSPIDRALIEWREFIILAKSQGWKNKAIAQAMRDEGFPFKASSTYLRLAKLHPNGAPRGRKPRKPTRNKET